MACVGPAQEVQAVPAPIQRASTAGGLPGQVSGVQSPAAVCVEM